MTLHTIDPEIAADLQSELTRQREGLEMIPSENFVSPAVLEALGSIGTNKYSEGYPGRRYYGGCQYVDRIEQTAIDRAKKLFGVDHANVQPYSGSPANLAVYYALLNPGDTVMGMHLYFGGHMTHGLKVNFSGTLYRSVQYQTRPDGYLDLDAMDILAQTEKPKMIVVGATAYPRQFDWKALKNIADRAGAFLLADISHIAGLIVGGEHPSPVGFADVITTTTHKTLRGPRGAMILCNGNPSTPLKKVERTRENFPTLIDRAIIPGLQGGPHNHQTAAIAVALKEAALPEFKTYAHQIVLNAKALADRLLEHGFDLVTGGTDNHLLLVDLRRKGVTGTQAEKALDASGITCNKNTIPFDPRQPFDPSGIRLGTPALTSRGMKEEEMKQIGDFILEVVEHWEDADRLVLIRSRVKEMTDCFPLYQGIHYV
ncbi:TPA: serine hydroxymethyltransferase [Candidatus Uhrbacteria bacterium]|uniref:Serine hydroxymethyltransferase n=2 Tax=Candidatus Uhriibacteriota TaxID=1752732 RepID=A0A0G1Q8I8_9BACT|nr:MAG: Serine hydroxymethyltransferase [Candidatus Uhrbacteria bacterium GW2011_GWF2_46_218]KKU41371.1 MAG: Serine hydroxymethyltransferase [Candidatus Uhrbacteria bacterium GW2011_GWE2_46_68]HBK33807.1 serine hydroxymethyltransferase [Candidatus Uhrbacteria bacterium]HCB19352.1 serine hydroxymethyltransferase [Candidatus Uhrbacteria bacterium]